MPSLFHESEFNEIITKALGQTLTAQELENCKKNSQILEPPIANLFFSTTDARRGIYIIIEGRARLFDNFENFITSLDGEASFGHATLFRNLGFADYVARASQNLRVCYLSQEILQPLRD